MADVKNFGLVGVGSNVQFGKAGPKLKQTAGVFQLRNAADGADAAITTAGITSSAGNISLTTGNLVLSSSGVITVGAAGNIGGSAAGVYTFGGTGALVAPKGSAAQQPAAASAAGGFRYNTDNSKMEYSDGATWTTIATGGTAVTAVSVASANGFAGTSSGGTTPVLTLTTSVTGLLKGNGSAISAVVSGTDIKTVGGVSLLGSGDVGVIGGAYGGTGVNNGTDTIDTNGNVLLGGAFTTVGANSTTLTTTGPTSLTLPQSGTLATVGDTVASFGTGTTGLLANGLATAQTGAVVLSGVLDSDNGGTGLSTFSAGSVLYATGANTWGAAAPGVTSGVQAYDAGLAALAAKTTSGIMVQTGADTYQSVSLIQPAAGITISNADGTTGSPTFALANDLAGVEGLSTYGLAARTADGVWTTRTLTGTAGRIVVTDGDGITSEPTFDLAPITQSASGTFSKVTLDGFGRVVGNTAVTTSDITALVDATYVNVAGDTMTGNLNMGTNFLTMANPPTLDTQAANKAYVDSVAAGLSWKDPAQAATTANLAATYANGTAGVGATLTNSGTQAALVVDGVTLIVGNRVLVKDQTASAQNGIYVVTAVGTVSTNWVLTRSVQMDAAGDFYGAAVLVTNGTANDNSGWTQTEIVATVGTDAVSFTQFSGGSTYVWGVGLSNVGNTVNINMGAGIVALPSDEVGIDVESGKAVQLTSTATGGQLTLVLDAGSGLAQSASGLKINALSVTNAMLNKSSFAVTADSGTDTLSLGDGLHITGTAAQGVSVAVVDSPAGTTQFTVTNANASSVQKGVASFATTEFVVTAGAVALGLVGATKGGTGQSSYAVGDLLYADTTTSLAKLADVATGNVLLSGGVGVAPSYGKVALGSAVSGILPAANGGTGVANTSTITLGGNISTAGALTTAGAFASTFTMTGATAVTFPTSGTLLSTANIAANAVTSFQTSLVGLTPSVSTAGAVTLAGTLAVASGGTGVNTLGANQIMLGNGTSPVVTSAALSFTGSTLTVGTTSITGGASDTTITSTATNGNIILVPTGTGTVQIGPAGAGLIQSDAASALTVRGNTTLTLESVAGSTTMALAAGTTAKVTVTGPTAAQYATGLADADLVNKLYVDQVSAIGNAGDVKAVKATFSISATGTFNIGTALPAGATILSVKAQITSADTGTGTLSIGKSGSVAAYATTGEIDNQGTGMYVAETLVVETGSVQVIGTVAGTPAGAGAVTVVVTYQLA
jgi:hypothetical protein